METNEPKRRLWTNIPVKRMISSNRVVTFTDLYGACSITIKGKRKEAVIVEQRGNKVKLSFDGGVTALPSHWFENSEIKRHW